MNSISTSPKTAIIYLSGAGLNPSIWDAVRSSVVTPGYALTYDRSAVKTLNDATQDILEQVQNNNASKYIIVAHSLGGVVGLEVAKSLKEKLAGFIGVSATIPGPGESFINAQPFPQSVLLPVLLRIVGTKPPVSAIRKGLCSDLTDEQATKIINEFIPEPIQLYTGKISVDVLPMAKYAYVRTLNDKQLPLALQTKMIKRLPDAKVIDIAGGHLPMVSHPDELATMINDFITTIK